MTPPTLHRTVRVHVTPGSKHLERGCNTYAGQPFSEGLCTYYEFDVACCGPADSMSGFVESIYAIDDAVRSHIVPRLGHALAGNDLTSPRTLMPELFELVQAQLESSLECLTWRLSPYYSISGHRMHMDTVTISRSYTFSSSHRLHNPSLDDAANEQLYGKCSWPSGHGHNYVMDVSLAVPHTPTPEQVITVDEIDEVVHEQIIDQFDHRYLNLDTKNFQTTIPTLENITVECHKMLASRFTDGRATIHRVRVYETDRTWCEYPPQNAQIGS